MSTDSEFTDFASGRRRQRRQRAMLGLVGAASCALVAGGLVTLGQGGSRAGVAIIDLAIIDPAVLDPSVLDRHHEADPSGDQAAPYWHLRVVTTATSLLPTGRQVTTTSVEDRYDGHGRPGVDRVDGHSYPLAPYLDRVADRHVRYPAGVAAPPLLGWDDMWALPQSRAGLTACWQQRRGGSDIDEFGEDLIHRPGPDAMHRAAADLLAAQPDVRTTTGHDSTGRPARILTRVRNGQTDVVYVDPASGRELERDVTRLVTPTLPAPAQPTIASNGAPVPAHSLGLMTRAVYAIDGPSASD